jgi:hypothetical protein
MKGTRNGSGKLGEYEYHLSVGPSCVLIRRIVAKIDAGAVGIIAICAVTPTLGTYALLT